MDRPKDDAARPPAGAFDAAPRGGVVAALRGERRGAKTMLENSFRVWGRTTEREVSARTARRGDGERAGGERQHAPTEAGLPEGAQAAESPALRALVSSTEARREAQALRPSRDDAAPIASDAEAPTAREETTERTAEDAAGAPAPEAPAAPRKFDPQTRLFRAEALAAHARGARAASVVRITSVSRWMLLASLVLALMMAAGLTAFGTVEETTAARGVLRADFGVQAIVSGIGGTVEEVFVRAGDRVEADGLIARLDAAPLEAELRSAEARLTSIEEEWSEARRALTTTHNRTATALLARVKLLTQSRDRQQVRITRRDKQVAKVSAPELAEVVEDDVRERRVEAADVAQDALLRTAEEREALRLQAATAYGTYRQSLAAGEQRVREARAQRDRARALLRQTELRAPGAGVIESLRGHSGMVLAPGDWIARVVRDEAPRTLVAFVPERDAAFLRAGAVAAVELDQLPLGEFGHLDATVVRVAGELADRSELVAALGETAAQGPHVRVQLALLEGARAADIRARLRPGTLVTARIPLRERRLLAIVFEPARRWLD